MSDSSSNSSSCVTMALVVEEAAHCSVSCRSQSRFLIRILSHVRTSEIITQRCHAITITSFLNCHPHSRKCTSTSHPTHPSSAPSGPLYHCFPSRSSQLIRSSSAAVAAADPPDSRNRPRSSSCLHPYPRCPSVRRYRCPLRSG